MLKILKNILIRKRSHTRNQLEDWLHSLKIDADLVADVSSDQWPAKNRVKSWNVKQYDFLNLPEYDLNKPWEAKEVYDIVFCIEIFEYVYNPMQAVTNLYNILKMGGELYVSFHFIYPHHSAKKIDYLRYTRWGVEKLLEEVGFRSWVIVPRYLKTPELIRQVYLDERMRGNNNNRGELHDAQGYLVKATK